MQYFVQMKLAAYGCPTTAHDSMFATRSQCDPACERCWTGTGESTRS
jgi:hypothetical protein